MAGIAIIVPGADFSQNNLGKVNVVEGETPLTYIRAGKSTYINTGILPSKDNAYELKVKNETISQQLGAATIGNPSGNFSCYNSNSTSINFSGAGEVSITGGFYRKVLTLQWNTDGTIVVKNADSEIVGNATAPEGYYETLDNINCPLYLFAINRDNSPTDVSFRCSIYNFKIKDSQGNVIHNFVPYLSVMGVPYFLDTVTNEKHYFTAGTDDIYYSVDGVNEVTYEM